VSTWQKLLRIDKRVIYLILFVVVSYPLLRPVGLPLTVGRETKGVYDYIEKLQPGDVVVMSFDYSPSSFAEQHPQAVAVLNHLMRKPGVKIICVAFGSREPCWQSRL